MSTLKLDFILMDTFSGESFAVADTSVYPVGFVKTNPSMEITPPGFLPINLDFTPSSVAIYNSNVLGISCDGCDLIPLPDGIYKLKYTLTPAYQYKIEKSFMRVDQLLAKLDTIQIKMDYMQCNDALGKADRMFLDTVEHYIQGAVAAANKCLPKLAMDTYNIAKDMIDNYKNK